MTRRTHEDRGAILIVTALSITLLLVIVAIVIDLGATRSDRRGAQLAADNAVAAAAFSLSEKGDAEAACTEAFAYLQNTLGEVFADAAPNESCSKFTTCVATNEVTVTRRAGPYKVVVHHPVLDPTLLNKTSTIGASPIAAGDDGAPCQRIGVVVTTVGDSYFGGVAGESDRESTIWAVARAHDPQSIKRPLNLLVLDRTGCPTLSVAGGATVEVASFVDTDGTRQPGVAGNDSDGSSCKKNEATITANGTSKLIAYGRCDPSNPKDPGTCETGAIETWATVDSGSCTSGTPGPDWPGCDEGQGSITPDVTKMPARLTRAPLDHRYNCKSSYLVTDHPWVTSQPIGPCTDDPSDPDDFAPTAGETDWVDELYAYVGDVIADPTLSQGPPSRFAVISGMDACAPTADVMYSKTNPIPTDPLDPVLNWYVDCDEFKISGGADITFAHGNVIFRDKVTISSGSLTINRCEAGDLCESATTWSEWDDFEEWRSSERGSWVYAGGTIVNNDTLVLNHTAVFLGPGGLIDQAGGSSLTWTAPNDTDTVSGIRAPGSAGPFEDLALWSEGTGTHEFAGGGVTEFEGVFFAGRATIEFSGNSPMTLDEAQFVANRLAFTGTTTFTMKPDSERSLRFDRPAGYTLIR